MEVLNRDWNSSRNFDIGSWWVGTALRRPATLLRSAEHSADVLSFRKETKMRLWPIFLRCMCETTCLANCGMRQWLGENLKMATQPRFPYLNRRNFDFRNRRSLDGQGQDWRDWLKLTDQVISQIGFVIPSVQVAYLKEDSTIVAAWIVRKLWWESRFDLRLLDVVAFEKRWKRRTFVGDGFIGVNEHRRIHVDRVVWEASVEVRSNTRFTHCWIVQTLLRIEMSLWIFIWFLRKFTMIRLRCQKNLRVESRQSCRWSSTKLLRASLNVFGVRSWSVWRPNDCWSKMDCSLFFDCSLN